MRPYVVIHNAVSANGLLTGFDVEMGLYYSLAAKLECSCDLVGSGTIVAAPEGNQVDDPDETCESARTSGSRLVIADGRGRVKCWGFLQRSGFWSAFTALSCLETPADHVSYLARRGVDVITCGTNRIDLGEALSCLRERHGVERLRVDSGGTLNSALLGAGLVDEVSLLVAPVIADPSGVPLFAGGIGESHPLELIHEERLDGGHVWLRYAVRARGDA